MEDGANVDSWAEELGILLHTLTGIGTSTTMRLNVQIDGETFVALVDSGSTHTFIHADAVNHLGLRLTLCPGLSVKVANGDHVTSDGVCPRTLLNIGDESFMVDLYSLPLAGFDIVLGVHCFCTLGPIVWDFSRLTMQFCRNGRVIKWSGVHDTAMFGAATIAVNDNLLDVLIVSFVDMFSEPRGLPPARLQDHRIHLLSATPPDAVRPYR